MAAASHMGSGANGDEFNVEEIRKTSIRALWLPPPV